MQKGKKVPRGRLLDLEKEESNKTCTRRERKENGIGKMVTKRKNNKVCEWLKSTQNMLDHCWVQSSKLQKRLHAVLIEKKPASGKKIQRIAQYEGRPKPGG